MLRFCKRLRHPRSLAPRSRREEQLRDADIFVAEMTEVDLNGNEEACMTEGGRFVAATARFSTEWKIIPLKEELLPKEYNLHCEGANRVAQTLNLRRGNML